MPACFVSEDSGFKLEASGIVSIGIAEIAGKSSTLKSTGALRLRLTVPPDFNKYFFLELF
jgi:hypothetical protein